MGGKDNLGEIASVLKKFRDVEFKVLVVGYTGEPPKNLTKEDCVEMSLRRTQTVKEFLGNAGCTNEMAAKGMGYVDDKGARCEMKFERIDKGSTEFNEQAILRKQKSWKPATKA